MRRVRAVGLRRGLLQSDKVQLLQRPVAVPPRRAGVRHRVLLRGCTQLRRRWRARAGRVKGGSVPATPWALSRLPFLLLVLCHRSPPLLVQCALLVFPFLSLPIEFNVE
ncbi:hypothetical protein DFJ73DRAFT_796905 [Zopfochytrium polystomum]|nr:hypothetical protein DFJ73DRAFT_796905 [Zopfochytrium polystomum]